MLTPPSDLDVDALVRALASWRLRTARFEYLPVGFGGHHWSADGLDGTRAFVTVDDLSAGFRRGADVDASFAALERAYRTAAALRDVGRPEFVVAPLESGDGVLLHRLDSRYAVSVAPF